MSLMISVLVVYTVTIGSEEAERKLSGMVVEEDAIVEPETVLEVDSSKVKR